MRLISLFCLTTLLACGAPPEDDALPPVDESACLKERLEPDGIEAGSLEALPPGTYVVSTTYLRLQLTKSTVAHFNELNQPIAATLKSGPALRVVTRLSQACNTARTLTVWKSEADMYAFVTSEAHSQAMAAMKDISRGGSQLTHWTSDETGFSWDAATAKLAALDTPGR